MNDCIYKDETCAAYCNSNCPLYYPKDGWTALFDAEPPSPGLYRIIVKNGRDLFMALSPCLWDGYEFKITFDYEEVIYWKNL